MISSLSNFGICFGFPAGYMHERLGPRWTSFTALLISTVGMILIWSTTLMKDFYHDHAYLQYIYFFIVGLGANFLYMSSLATNLHNFHPRHRGKVVGLLDGSFSGGPSILAIIYGLCFQNGHASDEQNQNLKGFYLLLTICFVVIAILGIFLLKHLPYDKENQDIMKGINDSSNKISIESHNRDLTGISLLKSFDFHFIFWAFVFCTSLQLMFQSNITAYLKSFELENFSTIFTTINPISGAVTKLFAGIISDVLVSKLPRVGILLPLNIVQTVIMIICIFHANNMAILVFALLSIGMANGGAWCLTPTITSEFFGLKYFSRNWGCMMFGSAVISLPVQKIYGWIYDSSITDTGSIYCYGQQCFTWSFLMAAVLSVCSCLFNVGVLEKELVRYRNLKQLK
ncbi:hypothetical protein CHS0354_022855 [Potamilus streckersoni]|uniref:Major facilitator superfamily (MFS) profile domain-containing protein n=1 Tax=Potamilus streckersoni TaxID=2493646 RepID=A0AAE0S260_9BIVA|nr:hypothetical protein CHS0354_022855 [Potamilus streckersoni]